MMNLDGGGKGSPALKAILHSRAVRYAALKSSWLISCRAVNEGSEKHRGNPFRKPSIFWRGNTQKSGQCFCHHRRSVLNEPARPTAARPVSLGRVARGRQTTRRIGGFPGESATDLPGSAQRRGLAKSVWRAGYALASREQNLEGREGDASAARPKNRGYSDCAKRCAKR